MQADNRFGQGVGVREIGRRRAFSRSSSRSRSRSSLLRPSRSPRLISSWRTQLPQRRVVDTQLVGDLADRLARAADDLHRVSFELIGELSSWSFPSQQDSFPSAQSHCRRQNALVGQT